MNKIIKFLCKFFNYKKEKIVKLIKLQISKGELLSIPEKELELFIQLTNFNNDVNILGDTKKLFHSWDTTKRNWEGLSEDNAKFFKDLAYDLYSQIYDKWYI